ncbi:MAG: peptidase M52 [Candidatus Eremiobacter antarcticus]|nr:hydrogenase maturation protease [Candidatus Eremiobacteraeota bacterium]MBC5808770.1 hydrogenase maturation protease [Candidatus Eremiobacteraeota bacterium]PZR61732.1 MAG: peptidase M52 [Candidatus Eremiobacter sp. RRmetagenome_bin22]
MNERVLVAGVGNIFFGDDGFGVEAVRHVAEAALPSDVKVADYGIRGVHLAYEMLAGYDLVIILDATPRGGKAGTLYVIEPDLRATAALPDAHSMALGSVFGFLKTLGGAPPKTLIIGCEPGQTREAIGLSEAVGRAARAVVPLVLDVLQREKAALSAVTQPETVGT